MSGHSKWKKIKHKKAAVDQKRGQAFSKVLGAIAAAARENPDPQFNPRLKSLIEQAKKANIPQENIERAIKRTSDKELQEIIIEGYGPGGVAMIIETVTDNSNRTIAEIRHILNNHQSKIAEPGSVHWSFDEGKPKFTQEASNSDRIKIAKLLEELNNHPDVQKVITNLK